MPALVKKRARGALWYRKQDFPLATVLIIVINALTYLWITGGLFWVSPNVSILSTFGLNRGLIIPSLFTYAQLHLWPSHLVVDMILLAFFGTLVERKVGWRTTLLIYFTAALTGGLVHLASSNAVLVGSSVGVFGLVGASIITNPILAIVGLLITPVMTLHASDAIDSRETIERLKLQSEQTIINKSLENVTGVFEDVFKLNDTLHETAKNLTFELEEYTSKLSRLEEEFVNGTISEVEYNQTSVVIEEAVTTAADKLEEVRTEIRTVETEAQNLSVQNETLHTELHQVTGMVKKFETTQRLREGAPSATLMHIVGMFTGYGCVLLLCPQVFTLWVVRINKVLKFVKPTKPIK